ncbi:MAG: hypothetical protein ABI777_04460, partial [Betaproteobacteria bacterium]
GRRSVVSGAGPPQAARPLGGEGRAASIGGGATDFGPWNPGITSQVPRDVMPLATIFRPDNVTTTIAEAEELHDLTGLDVVDLVAFRPRRLAMHELLIRITAEISVSSGTKVEDLGINFRRMVDTILTHHLDARMDEIVAAFEAMRLQLCQFIRHEVDTQLFAPVPLPAPARRFFGLLRAAPSPVATAIQPPPPDIVVGDWDARANQESDPLRRAGLRALVRVVAALLGRHGALWGTPELITNVATDLACNDFGSDEIGKMIDPLVRAAAQREGYALLPLQSQPVIMNTKGASAAGKSTMRPEQKLLAQRIGVTWSDFALISPDIWRKQLLDYSSLGTAYKYGGACTGDELHIIDQKLDGYMARKAQREGTTHLLIDRFRFDSFAPDSDEAGSNLLTRFGHTIYLFFMVTPPQAIVERAWQRGLKVGRYKAVDDLLTHNVDAYAGMPELFFTWALRRDKNVHVEVLDNSVPLGERPRTAAFGWNGEFNILDVKAMLDIERFRKVDVDAKGPDTLYGGPDILAPTRNTGFLEACARRLPRVNFASPVTGQIYLCIEAGVPVWADAAAMAEALSNDDARAGIAAVAPAAVAGRLPEPPMPMRLQDRPGADRLHTLGCWGAVG